jgi:hypothetical protein
MTARLTLIRDHGQDVQDRIVRLWLDEEPLGPLRYGETLSLAIAPGPHTLRAWNTLFTTRHAFEAAPGEDVRLQVVHGMTGGARLMVLMLGVAYLRVSFQPLPSGQVTEASEAMA